MSVRQSLAALRPLAALRLLRCTTLLLTILLAACADSESVLPADAAAGGAPDDHSVASRAAAAGRMEQNPVRVELASALRLADLRAHTVEQVAELLVRLEDETPSAAGLSAHGPLVMILYGDEAEAFIAANYGRHRDTVDRADRLQARGVLEIRICERWMRQRGVDVRDLPHFLETVPDGPAEERRLERAGYLRF